MDYDYSILALFLLSKFALCLFGQIPFSLSYFFIIILFLLSDKALPNMEYAFQQSVCP